MITRVTETVAVEGNVVSSTASDTGWGDPQRQRIEIDLHSGRIISTGEPRGVGDLVLTDDYLIFPGFADIHVHAREDTSTAHSYKECFRTAGEAAIHGGITAIADMPNNPQPPADDASYQAKRALAAGCPVDVLLYAAVGPQTRPLSFPAPYKVYMGPSVGGLHFHDDATLRDALARYRGQLVAFHAELPAVLREHASAATHARRRPPEAEIQAVELALELSEAYRLEPHICHLSTAAGLELIRSARARGFKVTCEVTPHHLFYDLDNAETYLRPDYLQCNPPLRSRLDRIALLDGLRAGEIDCVATDHAPHTVEEKEAGASGLTHLDTFGAFTFWLMEEGIPPERIRQVCSENPGRFLGRFLLDRYGKIEPGFVGSLTVLKPEPATIRRNELKTRAGWSPFEGRVFGGRVSHTIVRGHIYPASEPEGAPRRGGS